MQEEPKVNEEALPEHSSDEVAASGGQLYKFPKPERRPKNDTTHKKQRSKAQERGIARSYRESGFTKGGPRGRGADRVYGSGSISGYPGDVDPGDWFLAECKQTRTGRLVLDPEWCDKVEHQSRSIGRPWWAVHAWVGDETSNYRRIVVLSEDHFFELIKQLKAYEEG